MDFRKEEARRERQEIGIHKMKRKSAKVGGEKRRGEGRVRTKRREEVGGKERGGEGEGRGQ